MIAIAPYVVIYTQHLKKMRHEVLPEMVINSMNDRVY